MQNVILLSMLCLVTCLFSSPTVAANDYQEMIDMLEKQIEDATTEAEKAKLCCYKARNHLNNNALDEAEQGYLEALDYSYIGWILNEYSRFLLLSGEFERAYRAASKAKADFPQFTQEARSIMEKAKEEYLKEYQEANPPTIIMDTEVDPHRITRHDLIRSAGTRSQALIFSNKSASSSRKVTTSTKTVRRT